MRTMHKQQGIMQIPPTPVLTGFPPNPVMVFSYDTVMFECTYTLPVELTSIHTYPSLWENATDPCLTVGQKGSCGMGVLCTHLLNNLCNQPTNQSINRILPKNCGDSLHLLDPVMAVVTIVFNFLSQEHYGGKDKNQNHENVCKGHIT